MVPRRLSEPVDAPEAKASLMSLMNSASAAESARAGQTAAGRPECLIRTHATWVKGQDTGQISERPRGLGPLTQTAQEKPPVTTHECPFCFRVAVIRIKQHSSTLKRANSQQAEDCRTK